MDDTAVNRKRILDFFEKYGEKATIEAFQVSRRTLPFGEHTLKRPK